MIVHPPSPRAPYSTFSVGNLPCQFSGLGPNYSSSSRSFHSPPHAPGKLWRDSRLCVFPEFGPTQMRYDGGSYPATSTKRAPPHQNIPPGVLPSSFPQPWPCFWYRSSLHYTCMCRPLPICRASVSADKYHLPPRSPALIRSE